MSFATASNPSDNLLFRVIGQEGAYINPYTPSFCFNSLTPTCTIGTLFGVWTVANSLITARSDLGNAGTQNSALAIGGLPGTGGPVAVSAVERYNGTSWSATTSLITARAAAGTGGIETSALAFGGRSGSPATTFACTEAYNGTTWSAGGALISAVYGISGAGTENTAMLGFGGVTTPTSTVAYDGLTWTTRSNLINTRRESNGAAGSQNAALAIGNCDGLAVNLGRTEAYNGTTWSAVSNLISRRISLAGSGIQNAALAYGGLYLGNNCTCTEAYNGTTWTSVGALNTARCYLGGAGTMSSAALAFGGRVGTPSTSATEAFTVPPAINLSLTGEFANTNYNATQVSSPIYLSGSNASIYYGFWQPAGPFNNSTTYVILSD
jgi:hypothetical protein